MTVHFQLNQAGQRLPGLKLALEGPGHQTEGRLTDVMGVATLELVPGTWRITEPSGVEPRHPRVSQPDEWIQVELPPQRPAPVLEGMVVDERGVPVSGAKVAYRSLKPWQRLELDERRREVTTGADGRFSVTLPTHGWCQRGDGGVLGGEEVGECHIGALSAEVDRRRSVARVTHDDAREVRLVVTQLMPITVRIVGPPGELGSISADVGDQQAIAPTLQFPSRRTYGFRLPRGHVLVRACVHGAPLKVGRLELDLAAEPRGSEHELRVHDVQPVRGVVLGPDGGTLAGVEVGLATFFDLLDKRLVAPISRGAVRTTVTGADGQFRFELPASEGEGPHRVELFGAWKLDHLVFVHLDDPPLTLTAQPRSSP